MVSFLLIFIIGTAVGSFLNLIIDRLPKNQPIVFGRSQCDLCKKQLLWFDLVPLVSFVLLNGRCRYCHARLSYYYPIVETVTGALFALLFYYLGIREIIILLYYFFITSSLVVIFFTDLKYGIIPDKIIYTAIIASFLFIILDLPAPALREGSLFLIQNYLLSAIGAFLFFFTLFLLTRGKGMGFGDVKFALLMGIVLGFPKIAIAFYIAFLTGAGIAIILILLGKKKFRGDSIPFGPFLVFGTIVSMFWGERLLTLVLRVFLR